MERALQDVTSGERTVRRAALEHNVPRSTLHDRVSGRVLPGAVGGAPRYLNDEEEEELVRWLEGCAEVGCTKSVREVRVLVGNIVAKKTGLGPCSRKPRLVGQISWTSPTFEVESWRVVSRCPCCVYHTRLGLTYSLSNF